MGAAWLTIGKALGASGIASGDTVYIGPGVYREHVTVAMTSPTVTTNVIGDVDGSHTTDAPGDIVLTAFTSDTSSPAASGAVLSLAGRNFLSFQNIVFVGDNATPSCLDSGSSGATSCHDATFTGCFFHCGAGIGKKNVLLLCPSTGGNFTFSRCTFLTIGDLSMDINYPAVASADYGLGIVIQNSVFFNLRNGTPCGVRFQPSGGSGNFKGGGAIIRGCTFVTANEALNISGASSVAVPAQFLRNLCFGNAAPISINTQGEVVEDGNVFAGTSGSGSNTVNLFGLASLYGNATAVLVHFWQDLAQGFVPDVPALTPRTGSPVLAVPDFSVATGVPGTLADDATVGTITWTNPSNANYPNESVELYAVASTIPATTGESHYLDFTNFGLSVPSGATIVGIRVDLHMKSSVSGGLKFGSFKLIKGGALQAEEVTALHGSNSISSSDTWYMFGGYNNLLGATLAQSDVNASNFGFAVAIAANGGSPADASIDYGRVVVYYKPTTNDLSVDLANRPRPSGGATPAAGALERHDTGTLESGTADAGSALNLVGTADHEFLVPVDPANGAVTFAVKVRYDAGYSGGVLPQAAIVANNAVGVSGQTVVCTAAANTWQTLTFSAITPTAKGAIRLRLQSFDTSGTGNAYFDTATGM